ncbi:helix-turn-helix transcriptional regulator [Aeromicrobium wangtongii]|uniref:helix-turn-helix transcriptional regulator n=1 Tax=Aeromicrobium wangtongii TaxID=2969247 RepID=UPI0024B55268|nr:LuxR family transcriptional regulator [Aeromicrobium wangtongii]
MGPRLDAFEPALVGRPEELAVLSALLDRAGTGRAGTLLIAGDAGVGKTALVQRACSKAASTSSVLVLAGACLPLASLSVPFLAIRSALRDARHDGIPMPPAMDSADSPANAPIVFDTWLDDLARDRAVVLAVDDLHWADQSTLDVLMYVLAGPADRRLSVIATIRGHEVGGDHPLQRWLADVRRLPRVEQMSLGPLDRVATTDQLADLLGASPHQSLVEDVFTHTGGNPYLNRLVVQGLAPDARQLPRDLPADLRSAVLQSWRQLPSRTQELTRVLAVSGTPLHASDLAEVTGPGTDVTALLRTAVDAGTLDRASDGTYWFHHPLSAEVLEESLEDDERRHWHSAFADQGETALAASANPRVELMVAVADHHHRAGHRLEAYRWALRASEAAGAAGGAAEMLRLLRRAVDLGMRLPDVGTTSQELLRRLITSAAEAGAPLVELRAVDQLLDCTDADADPLLVAELMVRRAHLRFFTGHSFFSLSDMREACRLSSPEPTSWQHAFALAELAHTGIWHDDPDAGPTAARALVAARASGSPRALSYALTANAMAAVADNRGDLGLDLGTRAVDAAVEARDFWAYCHAVMWEGNAVDAGSTLFYAEHLRRHREHLTELRAPHVYIALLSADEADSWLAVGRWRECTDRLRFTLGLDPGPLADAGARLAAARLAAWQGRRGEAEAHLARVNELFTESSTFLNYPFAAISAEVHLWAGRPQAAYDAAVAGATSDGITPTMCEWLMPLASRSLADLVRADRDAGRDPSARLGQLDELTARFPAVIRDIGEFGEQWALQIAALDALYAAETGRARGDPENAAQWVRAAERCRDGMLAWEEAYACWRAAESLLLHDRHHRAAAAAHVRRGLSLAEDLAAVPLQRELQSLATTARIRTGSVGSTDGPAPPPETPSLPGLTTREREILAHVVAGRTYGEIARDLMISEKTVSSHISHLLHKTGTANRVDLARLAARAHRG